MRWTSVVAIYILFWTLAAFLVLPWGVRNHWEAGAERVPGQADGAPHDFRPAKVAIRITIVATIMAGLFFANYEYGWVTPQMLDVFNP